MGRTIRKIFAAEIVVGCVWIDSIGLTRSANFVRTYMYHLEEPSLLVDALQQSIMDAETLSQIIDIVSGLY